MNKYNWKDHELDTIWKDILHFLDKDIDQYQLITLIERNMSKAIEREKQFIQNQLLQKILAKREEVQKKVDENCRTYPSDNNNPVYIQGISLAGKVSGIDEIFALVAGGRDEAEALND